MKYQYHKDGTKPTDNQIFVFGSNESGIHGAGAALAARTFYGAILSLGFGPQGQSWAIPTKDWKVESLDLETINHYICRFKDYTHMTGAQFFVTRVGCGLAGYHDHMIAKMFKGCNTNCNFPEEWMIYLEPQDE